MPVVTSQMKTGQPGSPGKPRTYPPPLSEKGEQAVLRSASPSKGAAISSRTAEPPLSTSIRSGAPLAPYSMDAPSSALAGHAKSANLADPALRSFSKTAFMQDGDPLPVYDGTAPRSGRLTPDEEGGAAKPLIRDDGREQHTMIDNERLTVTGSMPHHPDSRFSLQHTPLPGARHTLSSQEYSNAPEMTMSYRLNSTTSASVALNPQDQTSPLYSPIVKENGLTATGVYLNMDMRRDVQLQFGGEVRSRDNESLSSTDEDTEAGAAVGLRWNF